MQKAMVDYFQNRRDRVVVGRAGGDVRIGIGGERGRRSLCVPSAGVRVIYLRDLVASFISRRSGAIDPVEFGIGAPLMVENSVGKLAAVQDRVT